MIVMSGMTGGKSVRDEELMGGIQEERYKMNEKYVYCIRRDQKGA